MVTGLRVSVMLLKLMYIPLPLPGLLLGADESEWSSFVTTLVTSCVDRYRKKFDGWRFGVSNRLSMFETIGWPSVDNADVA